jgi:peptide chain release factor 1
MRAKLRELLTRFSEIEALLSDPSVFDDPKKYRDLTQQHSYLGDVKSAFEKLERIEKSLSENEALLLEEKDNEMRALLEEEIAFAQNEIPKLNDQLEALLVPPNPNDDRNIILELRAGTGGDEAALFVGNCVRMYELYAAKMGWKSEHLESSPSEVGGFKEYIMGLSGAKVNRFMQYEGGTHRVQRVPDTETQGRVHTSAITVAVMMEPGEEDEIKLDEKDLRIDTYRASGAGGQHVNTTDSAVRITHLPTGVVAYSQQERSQFKNKDKALRLLQAKIADTLRREREAKEASARAVQVGSGDRSERIRTYNFPQNRLTDHRINLTIYSLDRVIQGDLDEVTTALVKHFHQKQIEAS